MLFAKFVSFKLLYGFFEPLASNLSKVDFVGDVWVNLVDSLYQKLSLVR